MPDPAHLTVLDELDDTAAALLLAPCCASPRWQQLVLAGRPYLSVADLETTSDAALAELGWDDVLDALAAHPRIGDRAGGEDVESRWSRAEQAGTADAGADVTARLRAGNIVYEDRFGRVFLVCATGLSAQEMLAELERRLALSDTDDRAEVREQLRRIVRLRLEKTFGGDGA